MTSLYHLTRAELIRQMTVEEGDCLIWQGRRVDEHFAHRLSIALECVLIDPDRNRQHAEETLEAYKAAWETVNPSPPTLMGELCTTDHKPEETKC